MPVVWSSRHRGHAPDGGYWLGVREAGDEEPERGDMLHDGLVAAGATIVDPPDLGLDPVLAVHDAGLRRLHAPRLPGLGRRGSPDRARSAARRRVPVRQPRLRRAPPAGIADRRRSGPSSGCT